MTDITPLAVNDRVRLTLAQEVRSGTVLGITTDTTRAAVEWDNGSAFIHSTHLLTRVARDPWDPTPASAPVIDVAHLERQRAFSLATFGPGARTAGVLDHITKELGEIRDAPSDVMEWVDLLILAFDGAWRSGAEPVDILVAIKAKQDRNERRQWPDWRTADPDAAIEHIRTDEADVTTGGDA